MLTVKILPTLLREITPKHVGDFYCLNCFHSYSTEKNFKNIMYAKTMTIVMEKCQKKIIKC